MMAEELATQPLTGAPLMPFDNGHEHRIGMTALSEQIKALVLSHTEVKEVLRDLAHDVSEMERRSNESCKGCALWSRVNSLEKELAGVNGRIAGVSLVAGALSFLAAFFVRK